ncbi:MAG: LacI family DNA-binding transcriptional regulator, partial [Ktedonobacteraceae bacterium]
MSSTSYSSDRACPYHAHPTYSLAAIILRTPDLTSIEEMRKLTRMGSLSGIREVAKRAGVSLGTVSNVLNRPEIVALQTRQRVQQA